MVRHERERGELGVHVRAVGGHRERAQGEGAVVLESEEADEVPVMGQMGRQISSLFGCSRV